MFALAVWKRTLFFAPMNMEYGLVDLEFLDFPRHWSYIVECYGLISPVTRIGKDDDLSDRRDDSFFH